MDNKDIAMMASIAKSVGGGSGGGSDVSITPTQQSGDKIADFSVGGTSGYLYAPNEIVYVSATSTATKLTPTAPATVSSIYDLVKSGKYVIIKDTTRGSFYRAGRFFSDTQLAFFCFERSSDYYYTTCAAHSTSKSSTYFTITKFTQYSIPSTTGKSGKVLSVTPSSDLAWIDAGLPSVTSADDGKVLRVSQGQWVKTYPTWQPPEILVTLDENNEYIEEVDIPDFYESRLEVHTWCNASCPPRVHLYFAEGSSPTDVRLTLNSLEYDNGGSISKMIFTGMYSDGSATESYRTIYFILSPYDSSSDEIKFCDPWY